MTNHEIDEKIKSKIIAMDEPGAIIEFDPDEAEKMGFVESVDDATWMDAILSSQDD